MGMVSKQNPYKKFVIETIKDYLNNKKPPTTFHPMDLIFPNERYTHSLMHGLVTSLGTTLWEPIAKKIAKKNNFTILDTDDFNNNAPILESDINLAINEFHNNRLEKKDKIEVLIKNISEIIKNKDLTKVKRKKIKKGDGLDLWLKKENTEYMFEIKTVQINAGAGESFSLKLCKLIAHRLLRGDPPEKLKAAVVFPYNPYKVDFYQKEKGKISPMIPKDDALAADDFWDILTEEKNSTKKILDAFKLAGKSGQLNKYKKIFIQS
jgi:hypothetical protein